MFFVDFEMVYDLVEWEYLM